MKDPDARKNGRRAMVPVPIRAGVGLPVIAALSILAGCVAVEVPRGSPSTVLVCHKGQKTLELPEPAVEAHVGHGDTIGPCS